MASLGAAGWLFWCDGPRDQMGSRWRIPGDFGGVVVDSVVLDSVVGFARSAGHDSAVTESRQSTAGTGGGRAGKAFTPGTCLI